MNDADDYITIREIFARLKAAEERCSKLEAENKKQAAWITFNAFSMLLKAEKPPISIYEELN